MTHPKSHYRNKVVLVTGAGGSIGSAICRKLIEFEVSKLIMLGHSELSLYAIEKELRDVAPAGALQVVLGSITDDKLMERLTEGVDTVINAAAHKHVPLCEENPIEAIQNNLGGMMTLADWASRNLCAQFIQVSTDKAVNPKGVMGATKRACELYTRYRASRSAMTFTTVRFGNVLDSSGSVLPLWREQLRQGKPITLTDRRCTRYFMSIPDAVSLTLSAGALGHGLFVLDMGEPRSIGQMAQELADSYEEYDAFGIMETPRKHSIVETGLRPGEKLTEELVHGGSVCPTRIEKVLRVTEEPASAPSYSDFGDILMAARCGHKSMALELLWSLVK